MKLKKKILIDLDRLKNPYNGLGQFALKLAKSIAQQEIEDLEFTFLVPSDYVNFFGKNVYYEVANWKRRYFSRFLPTFDLWHATHQDSNFYPNFSKTKYLLTIHDLNFLQEKSYFKAQKRLKHLQKKVDKSCALTTISYFSKNQIEKNLKIAVPMEVIYNGVEIEEPPNSILSKYERLKNEKFLLGIGVMQPKKNWHVLVEMMKLLPQEYLLVLAGENRTKYAQFIRQIIQQSKLQNRIHLIGKVTEKEKYFLLKNCYGFVFPSKYEGMGMPPIEAMSFGKPIFVFPNSSIPEFCKDYAFYWNSEKPQYMAEFLLKNIHFFYHHHELQQEMIHYAKRFQWKETAHHYVNLYRKILSE